MTEYVNAVEALKNSPDTRRMICVSTAHVTESDMRLIEEHSKLFGALDHTYGVIVPVHQTMINEDASKSAKDNIKDWFILIFSGVGQFDAVIYDLLSDSFYTLIETAILAGYDYLNIDEDGDEHDGLELHEW
jgi:hypothetical protein